MIHEEKNTQQQKPSSTSACASRLTFGAEICSFEADMWFHCMEPHAEVAKTFKGTFENTCAFEREKFEKCVHDWRAENDPKHLCSIRGSSSGLPPPQCAPLSCLSEKCLYKTGYDFKKCNAVFMRSFKTCVKALYLREYVD